MKRLVLLGASVTSLRIAQLLRKKGDVPQEIVLLTSGRGPVVERERFTQGIISQLKPAQIRYKDDGFFQDNRIDVIDDKTVTRVNVSRQKVHFNDRSQMDYDRLVIADTPGHKLAEIKGNNKEGVFGLLDANHMSQIGTLAALNDTIAIQSDDFGSMELALLLGQKGKEVILSISDRHPLVRQTDQAFCEELARIFLQQRVILHIHNPITEILGDSDVKAIKMASGKVYAAQVVVLQDVRADLRIFSEGLECEDGHILVDQRHRTAVQGVYAVDHVAQRGAKGRQNYGPLTDFLEYQASLVAADILATDEMQPPPLPAREMSVPQMEVMAVGQIQDGRRVSSQVWTDPSSGRLLRLCAQEGITVGMVGLNMGIAPEKIRGFVSSQRPARDSWEAVMAVAQDQPRAENGENAPLPEGTGQEGQEDPVPSSAPAGPD